MRPLYLLPIVAAVVSCTTAPQAPQDARPKVTATDLEQVTAVLKRDFHERGQAKMNRVELDDVQRLCNLHADNPPADVAKRIEEAQMSTIRFPEGSLIGNWKAGEKTAQSGRGSMWNDKPSDAGGSCYNCHQIGPHETSHGTLGPSLLGFGKKRGNGPEMQKYAYGKIYNSKAYNACSQMPRLGHAGTLSEQQIKDLVALLLDPESPVNK
jgi:L-cysteine S-thiosulfotransferase